MTCVCLAFPVPDVVSQRVFGPKKARGPHSRRNPELLFRGRQQILIETFGGDCDFDPFDQCFAAKESPKLRR